MIKFKPNYNAEGEAVTSFYKFDQSWFIPDITTSITCPSCSLAEIKPANNKWIGQCTVCKHRHLFLDPYPFQLLIQQTANKIINVFGGVGSAKSVCSASIVHNVMTTIPGIRVYAMAQTIDQLEQTSKEELDKFFLPDEFEKKNQGEWKIKNGSQILWIGSDSEQKLRGRNAGFIWLMEASSIPHEIHKQATQRIRQATLKEPLLDENGKQKFIWDEVEKRYEMAFDRDKSQLLLETNPHFGWVREHALLKSHTIVYSQSVVGVDDLKGFARPKVDPKSKKPIDMVSFLFSSVDNPGMTSDYLAAIRANSNSDEEFERDIYCNMSFTKGLVFGDEITHTDLFDYSDTHLFDYGVDGINKFWVEGLDPGGAKVGNDETGYILATYEVKEDGLPLIIPRACIKESGMTLDVTAQKIKEVRRMVGWRREHSKYFVCDPSGKKTNHFLSSYVGDLGKLGIYVNPEVNNDINFGIRRMKTFINNGRLVLPVKMVAPLVKEIEGYRWSENAARSKSLKKVLTLPIDRDNHLIDPLRYIIMKASISPQYVKYEEADPSLAQYEIESVNKFRMDAPSGNTQIYRRGRIYSNYSID